MRDLVYENGKLAGYSFPTELEVEPVMSYPTHWNVEPELEQIQYIQVKCAIVRVTHTQWHCIQVVIAGALLPHLEAELIHSQHKRISRKAFETDYRVTCGGALQFVRC